MYENHTRGSFLIPGSARPDLSVQGRLCAFHTAQYNYPGKNGKPFQGKKYNFFDFHSFLPNQYILRDLPVSQRSVVFSG